MTWDSVDVKVDDLIREHGDQAYHKALAFIVLATKIGDTEYGRVLAEASRRLMKKGYHKHLKKG